MKRVYRSVRDKKLFGVCGGLAEATGIDPTVIRIVLVITTFFSSGALIPIYIIAAMVMPKDPTYAPGGQTFYDGAGSSFGAPDWNQPPRPRQDGWNGAQHQPSYGAQPTQGYYPPNQQSAGSSIDDLMGDIEKKAMSKEIEQLKAKLAQYEKGQKGDD
ncbi:PspC domain-containing protein [Paenibacillus sp. TRM 82003]|nr:PspC domain-containing protein [Paenibacillus sp. TRM 82003]